MNITLLAQDKTEAKRVQNALREGKDTMVVVQEASQLLASLQAQPSDLVLLCVEKVGTELLRVIGEIREGAVFEPSQILLIGPAMDDVTATRAFAASLDGTIPRLSSAAYLQQRVAGVARVLARVMRKPDAEGAEPQAPSGVQVVTQASAWTMAPERLREAASQFLNREAVINESHAAVSPRLDVARSIVLTSAPLHVDMRFVVGTDKESARELANHLFGEADESLIEDMLGELSNIFMGALKTSFTTEDIIFTSGLPSPVPPDELLTPSFSFAQRHVVTMQLHPSIICVSVGLRSTAPSLVTPLDLREGMVLSKDVLGDRGLILLGAGTRLSLNMIEKLRGHLPEKTPVEVLAA